MKGLLLNLSCNVLIIIAGRRRFLYISTLYYFNRITMITMLFIYLFPVEIWGTVSDWVMVSVTSVTAFYLYKTLKSQQEVQKTQAELYKIESIRFKESIKPILNYSGTTGMMKPGEADKRILTITVTNETDSTALNITKILTEEGNHPNQVFIPMGFSDRRNHLVRGDSPLLFHFLLDDNLEFVTFTLKYEDVAGNKYQQRVFCICDNLGIEINPFLPKLSD